MKYSKQCEEILRTIQKNPCHPTADELYDLVRLKIPNISLGTVYRNLNKLADNGFIRRIDTPGGVTRFDDNLCKHYHFICKSCNKVYDVPYDIAPDLANKVMLRIGARLESFDITYTGICSNCKK